MHGISSRWIAGNFLFLNFFLQIGHAAVWHVAPASDDAGPGTRERPFATPQRAQDALAAGDTVWLRGGTYKLTGPRNAGWVAGKSGTADKPIRYFGWPGERPDFDCSGLFAQERIKGVTVTGGHLLFRGFALHHVPQNITTAHESWGIRCSGSDNVFEALDLHHIQGPGLFIAAGGGNLVLNCDPHHNYDPKSSNRAGFNLLSDTVLTGARVHRLRNNVSLGGTAVSEGDDADMKGNSWNLLPNLAAGEFRSVDTAGVSGPRGPGDALPDAAFLKPRPGGALIDHGLDQGLPFLGRAPDLGAFESGGATSNGKGDAGETGNLRVTQSPRNASLWRDATGR